ncbi:MAG TPA: RbsD/FucU domain-containing protein [Bryobacteraceae bacterium]|jgi:D-ribose pyranose/furanose isomerase RbsD
MMKRLALLLLFSAASAFCAEGNWKQILSERLPLYGHRNWIVVADSAYPVQSREGIETIVSGAGQLEVLKQVLGAIAASSHVRPVVYTDQELKFVPDKDARGVSEYRQQLAKLLGKQKVNELPHEQIIGKLDQVSQTFRVLIIKTNMTIPYTSVFLELNAGYWGADSEARLRAAMAHSH